MPKKLLKLGVISLLGVSLPALSATSVDLAHEPISFLQNFVKTPKGAAAGAAQTDLQERARSTDFNQTTHIRVHQTFAGYPIWGSDAVIHIPNSTNKISSSMRSIVALATRTPASTMNGMLYRDVGQDLQNTPSILFTKAQAKKALAAVLKQHKLSPTATIAREQSDLIVYMDEENKAHWAFKLGLYIKDHGVPSSPFYIVDAKTFVVYEQWNEVKSLQDVKGGGFGGNLRMGKLMYDGKKAHLAALDIQRDLEHKTCYLKNTYAKVTDARTGEEVSFACEQTDKAHNNLYWDGELDSVNGGYSPSNDALYAAKVIKGMYQTWYGVPVLIKKSADGKSDEPMVIDLTTHAVFMDDEGNQDLENALWDSESQRMFFADGETFFYPLTSLGVAAHEISHGFTDQHSDLFYSNQSGGINEAFSDMAAQAAEFYASGKNSWKIGSEIAKQNNWALRYLDQPSKDCEGRKPGNFCSFENIDEYNNYVKKHRYDIPANRYPDVHFTSGIYNRAFYLIATSSGWNVRKAFDVMVQANQNYWTRYSTFSKAACGVLSAAKDYKYDSSAIYKAFSKVGIDLSNC